MILGRYPTELELRLFSRGLRYWLEAENTIGDSSSSSSDNSDE